MQNIITGRITAGNTVIISGRYKLDIPSPETPDLSYIRTADIVLDQQFRSTPTGIDSCVG